MKVLPLKNFFKKSIILASVGLFSSSLNCTITPKVEKIGDNNYLLDMNSIKVFSKEKWEFFYSKNPFIKDSNLVSIGGKLNKNYLNILFFPDKLFDFTKYPLLKELYDNKINPFLSGNIIYDQDLRNIQADSIYRMRYIIQDMYKRKRGICWELRFHNNIIQSVFVLNKKDSTPPKDNSIFYSIISDLQFNPTSKESYKMIVKNNKKLYKIVEKQIGTHAEDYMGFPELLHLFNLMFFLNEQ